MAIRTRDALRRDQQHLLAEYRRLRRGRDAIVQLPTPGTPTTVFLYGRIDQVVTSDAEYGAHLRVVPLQASGTPPVFADATAAVVRCYPAPNHVVGDYRVNEQVKVLAVRGAFIADKSA